MCIRKQYYERTGTPFNFLEYPTEVVFLVVLGRLRYKLSLRDVAEMFLERGFAFDELRHSFRPRSTKRESKPLVEQRRLFCQRFADLQALVIAIS